MKKLTRLLSILMLIVMCISLMSVSASAAGVVVGGNTGSGNEAEEPRIVGNGGREVTGTGTYDPSADLDEDAAEEKTEEVKEAPKGTETVSVSDYSLDVWSYVDQSYPNVAENKDQILYVLNGYSAGTISKNSSEMKDLLALFKAAVQPAITAIDDAKIAVKSAQMNADVYAQAKSGAGEGAEYEKYRDEYLANPVKVYLENKDIMPKMMMMSGIAGTSFKATVNGTAYTDLSAAIKAATGTSYEIVVTGTQTYTEGIYSINLGGNVFSISGGNAVFNVTGGTYSFYNGTIKGDGFIAKGSSTRVVINGITVKNAVLSAVSIDGGATVSIGQDSKCYFSGGSDNTVDLVSGTLTMNADVTTSTSSAIGVHSGTLNINGGAIKGQTGIYMLAGTLNYNNPNGSVAGSGNPASYSDKGFGAAIASNGDNATINILSASAGTISSSKNGAIVVTNGAARTTTGPKAYGGGKIHVANSEWLVKADDAVLWSDYTGAVAAIGNTEYATLQDAVDNASAGDTVKLLCNYTLPAAVSVGKSVNIDGQGYTMSVTNTVYEAAVVVNGGTVQLKNIDINCNGKSVNGVLVKSGTVAVNNLSVHNCPASGIYNIGGTIDVNGYVNDSTITTSTGFSATAGTTKVHACTIDCPNPIDSTNHKGIAIDGGSFRFSSSTEAAKKALVDSCTIQGATGEQEGNYYVIEQNSAVIILVSGYDTSAEDPYFWYFKGLGTDNEAMQFTSEEAVSLPNATATRRDGTSTTVYITLTDGVYTIDANQVKALPAGSYSVRIPFVKGNYCDIDLEVYSDAQVYCYKSDGSKYWYDSDKTNPTIPLYDATQNKAGLLTFTDKPVKVGITYNAADVNTITWLDDIYFNSDNTFTLIQEDLNKLPAGLNYVVLKYDDDCIFGAQIYVKKVDASISPETLKWSTLVGDSTFTVLPDIKTVKFDGKVLTKDVDYTINKAGKLIVKGSFLKSFMVAGTRTEHKLLVETSKGNVVSTITIGEDLKNNGVNYHIYGGTATLSFIGSSTIDFEDGIWIGAKNPVQVPTDYVVKTTGTTFSIKAEYLNKLTYGTYTIGAYVDGTYCTTTFLITSANAASYVANTGDTFNAWIWIAILLLVAVIFFVILLPKIKGSKNKGNVPEETVPEEDTSKKD